MDVLNKHLEDVIQQQVDSMKYRESEQERIRDEAQLKRDTIKRERMLLEDFVHKHSERVKHLESLPQ